MDWKSIEEKWQKRWAEACIFQADRKQGVKKFFITIAFPYPNMPFHVGHGRPYTLTDVYARYMRMRGYNVLFPMAFHYTGTPILAIAKRVAAMDKDLMNELKGTYNVSPEQIKKFVVPLNIATYFREEMKRSMIGLGYSIDWRREFTTIDPQFNRFVEWQFRRLRNEGLITKGSHPVGWCPNCDNPLGQHDTKGDVEPEIGEFTLLKFKLGSAFLPTGTLRPETVFGVTNLWVRPEVCYMEITVDDEKWIVSRECATKLTMVGKKVELLSEIAGWSLLGKTVENPMTCKRIPILPAEFVDPANATGVVMSVPGHAPFDWVALEELKTDPKALKECNLSPEMIEDIQPISLIRLEGHSEFPAQDILEKIGATRQDDHRLEDATKQIYSKEYHLGVMKENTGKYAGLKVSVARPLVEADLISEGRGDRMYELLNHPIYCRCGAEAVVKVLEDQWFINYGDRAWKEKARACLAQARIIPNDLRVEFENVIEWLKEKACARRQGMGTKLPWDRNWIIESLSDSVIYMAYYTLAKHIYEHGIPANNLNDIVFDYLLLGIGTAPEVAEASGIEKSTLEDMREEFIYFYPLNSRNSGRDLVPNHLAFFIFNHASIFPKFLWPKQIAVTGSVLMEGKKMSKSLGNIIPLLDAIRDYGADPFRLSILSTAELLQDADFSPSLTRAQGERLSRFFELALELANVREEANVPLTRLDKWLLSRLQEYIAEVTEAMENLRFREAIHSIIYLLDQDLQWYLRRAGTDKSKKLNSYILRKVLETRILMLAPFTPHLCEEIWEALGGEGFVSTAKWPTFDPSKLDLKALLAEDLVKSLYQDVQSILQATKLSPKKMIFYLAASWKWTVYLRALRLSQHEELNVPTLFKQLMSEPELRQKARNVTAFARELVSDMVKAPEELIARRIAAGELVEYDIVYEAKAFFTKELMVDIEIVKEEDPEKYDPKGRAKRAEPYRPAIYIE